MKLISWNVAGFRACLNKGFKEFFESVDADIFCLQEVKAEKHQILYDAQGYFEYLYPAQKKGYAGTLVYAKQEPLKVTYGMGIAEYDNEGRMITLEYETFFLINVYVPNVKRDLSRMASRMAWEDYLLEYLQHLEKSKPVIICGDFNVAHQEIDIKNAKANRGHAGFTDEERNKFEILLNKGFIDTFRYLNPDVIKYSWWTYLFNARTNNVGWRIDYFLVSQSLKAKLNQALIHDEVMGSDHCPVGLEIDGLK